MKTKITIETKQDTVEMIFSNPKTAELQFNQIKAQGQFLGAWLTNITKEELKEKPKKEIG